VLRELLVDTLRAPPCYVAFSGGRDSSAVLAVATDVARAEGLELPIPVTELYPTIAESNEDHWQRMVLEHLRLTEWIRISFTDENDLLGETARRGLRQRGLIWPPALQIKANTYTKLAPGTLLTGEGGDEVFGARRVTPWRHLSRRTPVSRRLALAGALEAVLPRPVRRARVESELRASQLQPWLRPAVNDRHLRLLARDTASEPLRWDRSLQWLHRRRGAAAAARNHRLVGGEFGISVVEPLLDPAFLVAFGHQGGPFGYPGRTAAMTALFDDVLPRAVIDRGGKAIFNRVFLGASTRAFAGDWDGSGLDPELVDVERLRQEWLAPSPSAISSVLLQAAWLASGANP
jgi:asparagine synthetase B (glutamine-hydrolysing)